MRSEPLGQGRTAWQGFRGERPELVLWAVGRPGLCPERAGGPADVSGGGLWLRVPRKSASSGCGVKDDWGWG